MANDEERPPSERLRALYRRFCADQDLYWRRYCERSLAETEHLTKIWRRADASAASTTTEDE